MRRQGCPKGPSNSLLCTWNGDWGDFSGGLITPWWEMSLDDLSPTPDAAAGDGAVSRPSPTGSSAARDPCPALDPEADLKALEAVAERCRADPRMVDLWAEVSVAVQGFKKQFPGNYMAWALELCPRTYERSGEVRVHVHVAFLNCGQVLNIPAHKLVFKGSPPGHLSRSFSLLAQRNRNGAAALAYLVVPKSSTVWSECTVELFSDLPLSAMGVFAGLQSRKYTVATARALLQRIPKGIDRHLAELDRFDAEQSARAVAAVREWRARHSSAPRLAWRSYRIVMDWVQQYDCVLDRYRFLVIDGPSQMGKTQYVRGLCGPGELLEVDMSGDASICLRDYSPTRHTTILFDEASPMSVIRAKKLFQAGDSPVAVQTSATNCHAYTVYVAGKRMVIATNIWAQQLRKMDQEDVEWLQANSYYLHIMTPMWIPVTTDRAWPTLPFPAL